MLDTGSYSLDALGRPTRLAIKQLGLAVAEQLAVMRALREHPPVTVVKARCAALLVAGEVQGGTLGDGRDRHRVDSLEISDSAP